MDLFNTVSMMPPPLPEASPMVHTNAKTDRSMSAAAAADSQKSRTEDFQSVLKKVGQEKSSTSQKNDAGKSNVQELNKNIESLEDKIKAMKAKATPEQKAELEKLEKFLSKLKQVLSKMKTAKTNNGSPANNINIDLVALMSQMLEDISQVLDQDKGISKMSKKLSVIEGKLDKVNIPKTVDTQEAKLIQDESPKDQKQDARTEKVKVIDRRTVKGRSTKSDKKTTNTNEGKLFKNALNQSNTVNPKDNSAAQAVEQLNTRTVVTQQLATRQYTSFSSGVSRAHMESLMHTITGKAVVNLLDGKSEVRMRLNPPELGMLKIKFSLEDGKMIGKVIVATAEAKMLFEQNLWDLQKSLQEAGIDVQSMDVNVGGEDSASADQELFAREGGDNNLIADSVEVESERQHQGLYDSSVNYIA